jgi:UDP-glucose 4-epimerase
MMILTERGRSTGGRVIPVFGVGFIGAALIDELKLRATFDQESWPLSWADAQLQCEQLGALEERLVQLLVTAGADSRLELVWSAGRAGFEATDADTQPELASFAAVLDMVARLERRRAPVRIGFSLTSSAGGLFEGQNHVGPDSTPAPRRPYGVLKLRQEQLLADCPVTMVKRVYRLTSVYGHVRRAQRRGLVATLLLNGLRQRVSSIIGRMSTLRDFTWVEDIARFIGRDVMADSGADASAILASGRPSSIYEIQRIIETVIGRAIYVSYAQAATNREDTTFARHALPAGWRSSDLRTNISRMYHEAIGSGIAFEKAASGAGPRW